MTLGGDRSRRKAIDTCSCGRLRFNNDQVLNVENQRRMMNGDVPRIAKRGVSEGSPLAKGYFGKETKGGLKATQERKCSGKAEAQLAGADWRCSPIDAFSD